MRAIKVLGLAGIVTILGWAGACSEKASDGDGESHFLTECSAVAHCASGLDCICGACTKACTGNAQCSGLNPQSTCVEEHSCDRAACGISCLTNADCAGFGKTTCLDGVCSVHGGTGALPDGSVLPGAPDSGTSPPLSDAGTPVGRPDTGSTQPQSDSGFIPEGDAGACCVSTPVHWSYRGTANAHSINNCNAYTRTETSRGNERTCYALVPGCTDPGITIPDLQGILRRQAVVTAIKTGAVYGKAESEGTLEISVKGRTLSVGPACDGAPGCVEPPEDVAALAHLLRRIDVQETGRGSCKPDPRCYLPRDHGACSEDGLSRFGYDTKTGACSLFAYGGCGGNDNRFDTLEACEAACPAVFDSCLAGNPQTCDVGHDACFSDPVQACGCYCSVLGHDGSQCTYYPDGGGVSCQ